MKNLSAVLAVALLSHSVKADPGVSLEGENPCDRNNCGTNACNERSSCRSSCNSQPNRKK